MKSVAVPILAIALLTAALTGCTPTAAGGSGGAADNGAGKGIPAASGGCSAAKDSDYALFSDEAVSAHPKDGFTFGDGSTASFVYDKFDATRSPTFGYDLAYIQDNGSVIVMTGAPFFTTDGGTFSTKDKVFKSEANGRYGFFTVSITQDASFDGTKYAAKTLVLGRYCTKFVVKD